LLPTCREMSRLSSEAFDRRLGLLQRTGMRLHWLFCRWCRRYVAQLHLVRRAAHREDALRGTGRTLSPDARDRMKRRLRDQGHASASDEGPPDCT
jgi:hypothetical protein